MLDKRVAHIHTMASISGISYAEMERRVQFLEENEPTFALADAAAQIKSVDRAVQYVREERDR